MFGDRLRKSHFRYAINRWVLPRLGTHPLAIKNLSRNAWPQVVALTGRRDGSRVVEVDWQKQHGNCDASATLTKHGQDSQPVVLRGYLSSAELAAWQFDLLKSEFGDLDVPVRVGDYVQAPGDPELVMMPLGEFIDVIHDRAPFPHQERLHADLGPYVGNRKLPPLAERVKRPSTFPATCSTNFWLGGASAQTPLHCHQHGDALLTQLIGSRTVMFVPPHHAPYIGTLGTNVNICTAAFDPFAPNLEEFPGADLIDVGRVDLQAGDALLIPGFWFHAVALEGPSLSVTLDRNQMPASIGGGPVAPWLDSPYQRGW